jgi:hypothetical protein
MTAGPKSFGIVSFSSAPQERQQKGEQSSVSEVGIDVFFENVEQKVVEPRRCPYEYAHGQSHRKRRLIYENEY